MNDDRGTSDPALIRTIILVVTLMIIVALVVAASMTSTDETGGGDDQATPAAPDPVAEVESVLKSAATAEERYLTSHSRYTERIEDLQAEGLVLPPNVQIIVEARGGRGYCITAGTAEGIVLHYDSDEGRPAEGPCPPS